MLAARKNVDAHMPAAVASTLASEKRWNAMLSLDRQGFIEALSDVPPRPAEMEHVLAFNRGTGEAGTSA